MGKSTVFANSQGISNTGSGGVTVSGPDVCLTPMGSSLVPVPYTNIARSATLTDGSKSVKVDGCMGAIDGCCYRTSTGDQPGTGRGVASGTVGDKAEFINSSHDVKIEGRGACRNYDPMTQNNRNARGVNRDSASPPTAKPLDVAQPEPTTFRFRVVEHLSWDNYDEEGKRFIYGHKKNKAISGMKFKIKMPDGSIIEKTTDEDGVIELPEQDPCSKYEVIFEPEEARMNNIYYLFYNACRPLKNEL
jgi:hypothetical protein